jgi:capsular polysaccharide transport system permease protein
MTDTKEPPELAAAEKAGGTMPDIPSAKQRRSAQMWLLGTWRSLREFLWSNKIMGTALVLSFIVTCYWLLIASDRYLSEAIVIVEDASLSGAAPTAASSLLSSITGAPGRSDQMVLQNYLLSNDMLVFLDKQLDLRSHYSSWSHDPFSRLFFKDMSQERFLQYYLSRVSVQYDDYSGQVTIQAQAFDPVMAHAISTLLVEKGEAYINDMEHQIAAAQVAFLEADVERWQQKSKDADLKLLDFENTHQLLSPPDTASTRMAAIDQMHIQKAALEMQRSALLGYLTPNNPAVINMNMQIDAIDKQVAKEKSELTSPHNTTLNSISEEYLRLKMDADFATATYQTALTALEAGRVGAARLIKKVSVIEHPTMPEASMVPTIWINSLVFTVISLMAAGIIALLTAIVRDHRD